MGFTLGETTWAFSLAILFLGLSAGFLGSFAERLGPRRSGFVSAGFFGTGLLGTALALHLHSLWLLYLCYGCIGGIGLGIGYITPVSTLVKWFPERRGFATGLAIMGFGFASLIAGPVMRYLTDTFGLTGNFLILAVIYTTVIAFSASYLAPPRPGDVDPAERLAPGRRPDVQSPVSMSGPQYTRKQDLHTWQFYTLWGIFFINITCGIGLLAVASPMAQETVGMTSAAAASMVGIIGLMNGFGRIAWSTVSDRIGRGNVYILFFLLEIFAFLQLSQVSDAAAFQCLVFLIITCYGGGFSCMPAYLSDIFGIRQLSAIHGCILTAWGMAGIAGPLFLSFMKESTGSYGTTLQVFSLLFVVSLTAAAVLKKYAGGEGIAAAAAEQNR